MGKMKDIVMEIEEMLNKGFSFEGTAFVLDVPVSWVIEVAEKMTVDFDEYTESNYA